MNAVQLVEKMARRKGIELTAQQKRALVRSYKLDKLECGKRVARRLLREYLTSFACEV